MMSGKVKAPLEFGIVVLIFLSGLFYFCFRILGFQLQFVPGDLGDSRFVNYLLEHGFKWVSGQTVSFWNAPFMQPFPNTLALSDTLIGTQCFYFPWRLMGFSIETSYQFWWICICGCNYWLSYWAFHKFFQNKLLAGILAWAFAFNVFNLGQLNYMQMMVRFPVAPAFYAAYRLIEGPKFKYLVLYCSCIVYQFYCVPYIGFYLFYFSLFFLLVYVLIDKTKRTHLKTYVQRNQRLKTVFVLAGSVLLLTFILLPYYKMSQHVGLRLYKEVVPGLPSLRSFLLAHESSYVGSLWFEYAKAGNDHWWLSYVFPGLVLLGTLIVSPVLLWRIWLKKNPGSKWMMSLLITSGVLCLLHLRIGDHLTLYGVIFKLPGINSMRVLNRFMHVELFILLLILGYSFQSIPKKYLLFLFIALVIDSSFDSEKIIRQTKLELQQRKGLLVERIVQQGNFQNKSLALVDTLQPAYLSHLDAMLASQELNMGTVNGYSSYCPDAYGDYFNTCSAVGLNHWLNSKGVSRNRVLVINRSDIK